MSKKPVVAPSHPAADLEYLFDEETGVLIVQPFTEPPADPAADNKEII